MNLEKYTVDQATHNLSCRHQIGHNGYNYTMPCIVLGRSKKSGNFKIVVFGDRAWANKDYRKRIRYVNRYKLTKRTAN